MLMTPATRPQSTSRTVSPVALSVEYWHVEYKSTAGSPPGCCRPHPRFPVGGVLVVGPPSAASRSSLPAPAPSSHPVMAGNSTACGQRSFDRPTSTIPDPDQEILPSDKSKQNTTGEKKSDWISTASATANPFTLRAGDAADASGPFNSVVVGLCFILD